MRMLYSKLTGRARKTCSCMCAEREQCNWVSAIAVKVFITSINVSQCTNVVYEG